MNTFLPLSTFAESAACLDRQRLGKQRVEARQILECLLGVGSTHWRNHPAVRMWAGYEGPLVIYGITICQEWIRRGYRDTQTEVFLRLSSLVPGIHANPTQTWFSGPMPWWLGWESFHASHRSNLLRKMPEHYLQFKWEEPAGLPYIWPTERERARKINA